MYCPKGKAGSGPIDVIGATLWSAGLSRGGTVTPFLSIPRSSKRTSCQYRKCSTGVRRLSNRSQRFSSVRSIGCPACKTAAT